MTQIASKPELTTPIRIRFQPQAVAAMTAIASYSPGSLSDHIRYAAKKYIESEIAALELRVSAALQAGQADSEAQRQLAELRAAYTGRAE